MPDKSATLSSGNESSISWKLIRENLARRELAGNDLAEVESVSSTVDGSVIVTGKDAAGALVRRHVEPDAAFARIVAAATQTSQQIQELHDQARREAVFWFWASAAAAVLGFVLVVGGIVAVLFFQQNAVATFSAVSGVLLEAIAALLFRQRTEANQRVDGYRQDLLEAQSINQAIELCKVVEDSEARKRLIEEIIKTLLGTAMGQKSK